MRKLLLFLVVIFTTHFCKAQFYKSPLSSPEFSNALEKIVLDFRSNFSGIAGDNIVKQDEADIYESTIKLPGAIECSIYTYHSQKDTTASWIGVMYRGDDFKEASKVYENVFKLVKKSQIKWIDKSSVVFSGDMEKPKQELRFTVSTLSFLVNDYRYKNFKAEVEMETGINGWEVHLNLHSKKPDTDAL